MDASRKLYELFIALIEQLPALLVLLACLVFALIRWKRYPKVSLLVFLSLSALMVHGIISAVVYNWVPDWFIQSAPSADVERVAGNVYLVLGLLSNGSLAVAFAVLLAAIFTQRGLAKRVQ